MTVEQIREAKKSLESKIEKALLEFDLNVNNATPVGVGAMADSIRLGTRFHESDDGKKLFLGYNADAKVVIE